MGRGQWILSDQVFSLVTVHRSKAEIPDRYIQWKDSRPKVIDLPCFSREVRELNIWIDDGRKLQEWVLAGSD